MAISTVRSTHIAQQSHQGMREWMELRGSTPSRFHSDDKSIQSPLPHPRYETWDVTVVLQYIESLGSSDSLPLQILSWKLAMLLALTGHQDQQILGPTIQEIHPRGGGIPGGWPSQAVQTKKSHNRVVIPPPPPSFKTQPSALWQH